jgi:hypothetical protein
MIYHPKGLPLQLINTVQRLQLTNKNRFQWRQTSIYLHCLFISISFDMAGIIQPLPDGEEDSVFGDTYGTSTYAINERILFDLTKRVGYYFPCIEHTSQYSRKSKNLPFCPFPFSILCLSIAGHLLSASSFPVSCWQYGCLHCSLRWLNWPGI